MEGTSKEKQSSWPGSGKWHRTRCPHLQMSIRVTWETSQNTDALGPREHGEQGFLEVYHTTNPQKLTPVSGVLWELLGTSWPNPPATKVRTQNHP